jgi:uncharacterized protein
MSPPSTHREIVRLPALTDNEVEDLLASEKICRMALNDDPQPYIIALDYLYLDGKLYFHLADYGRKMEMIKRDPHVSVEIDNFCNSTGDFATITLMGQIKRVTNKAEKVKAAEALIGTVKARGGKKNVAMRHGFKSMDVDAITSPPSTLYRLEVCDYVALKSLSK